MSSKIQQLNWWSCGLEVILQATSRDLNYIAEGIILPYESKLRISLEDEALRLSTVSEGTHEEEVQPGCSSGGTSQHSAATRGIKNGLARETLYGIKREADQREKQPTARHCQRDVNRICSSKAGTGLVQESDDVDKARMVNETT